MPTLSQWIHVAALVLGGLVVVAGIYNDMQAATALGVFVTVLGAVGAYLGGPTTPPSSTPATPSP